MRALTVTLLAALALGGCAYGFEDDDARFECNSDDDCVDGDKCAGFALVQNSAKSFCIDELEASAAIGMRVPNPPLDGCQLFGPNAGSTWTASVRLVDTSQSYSEATFDPATSTSCDSPSSARRGGADVCCIGGPDREESLDGRASVLCFFPPESVTDAELTLTYTYGKGTGSGSAGSGVKALPASGDPALLWDRQDISGTPTSCPQ
jgi:hypothetical protein